MRKPITLGVTLAMSLAAAAVASAQHNPRGKSAITVHGAAVTVEYGRPSLHGQTIGAELARLPVGQYWRLGADKSATFTTSANLRFGGATVPKGAYSLFALKKGDKKWALAFNKQTGQWGIQGNGAANLDPKRNVALVPLHERTAKNSDQMVTITLAKSGASGGTFTVQWGDMELSTRFTVEK